MTEEFPEVIEEKQSIQEKFSEFLSNYSEKISAPEKQYQQQIKYLSADSLENLQGKVNKEMTAPNTVIASSLVFIEGVGFVQAMQTFVEVTAEKAQQ